MKKKSDNPQAANSPLGQRISALGSFLQFIGVACCKFDNIASQPGQPVLVQALDLAGSWQDFFTRSQVAAPINLLAKDIAGLIQNNSSLEMALKDYNALFRAPELPVTLWESAWLSEKKILYTFKNIK